MEKKCYICGVVGFEELIVTCMDCKSIFVHLYCMKIVQFVPPNDWMCEDCPAIPKQGKTHISSPNNAYKTAEVPMKRVEKDRYTDPLATSLTRCDVPVCIPEKPSELPTAEQSRFKKHIVDDMPSAVPESAKKQKTSSVSKPSPDLEKFKELFIPTPTSSAKSRRGFAQGDYPYKGTLKEYKNTRNTRDQRLNGGDFYKGTLKENKNTRDQRLNGNDSYKDTLEANKNTRDQKLSGEKWKVDRYLPNHPASNATWKGCFRTSGFSAPVSSYVTVWGYPPAKVGRKAYEFSTKMPDVLPFEAIPRCAVWTDMFSDGAPNKNDIGLYFFPNDDRSEQHYSCLVSHLEKQDIVLKSCIYGIELLVFSSSFLDEKSKEINQAYYLWGLFVDPVNEPDPIQLPSETNTEAALQHRVMNENDIDMAVGVGVKQAGSEVRVKLEKWDGDELPSPPGFPAAVPRVVPSVPPGFEQAWRVKYKTIHEILQSQSGR